MKKVFLSWMLALVAASGWAQEQFTGIWQCEELKASIVINLMEKKIPLKDFEGEDTYGYVRGDLNGTWVILKVKEVKDRFVCTFLVETERTWRMMERDGNVDFSSDTHTAESISMDDLSDGKARVLSTEEALDVLRGFRETMEKVL